MKGEKGIYKNNFYLPQYDRMFSLSLLKKKKVAHKIKLDIELEEKEVFVTIKSC